MAILRTCHKLTEQLAALAMRPISFKGSTSRLIEATKRVPYRVDDVVRSMYPPLDARLLEARLAALVLAVGQVALLTQSISVTSDQYLDWIDDGLNEMDSHLMVSIIKFVPLEIKLFIFFLLLMQILRKVSVQIDEQNCNKPFNSSIV